MATYKDFPKDPKQDLLKRGSSYLLK